MSNQTASLTWRDTDTGRVPISDRFDDPYYSLNDGLAETHHVFINGNNLPDRFGNALRIAELGFGTGLNLLATWDAWQKAQGKAVHFTSFEAYPMAPADMATALAHFPQLAALTDRFLAKWHGQSGPVQLAKGFTCEVITGDARITVPAWQGTADAWYLDGFSPAKNPALWEPDLLASVGAHTAANGTAATYSAAGHVRQSLTAAGFDVQRVAGFGRKRHMTVARRTDAK